MTQSQRRPLGSRAVLFIVGMVWATGGIAAGALFISAATAAAAERAFPDRRRGRQGARPRGGRGRYLRVRAGRTSSYSPSFASPGSPSSPRRCPPRSGQARARTGALDLVLLHVAGAAVDLQGVVGHLVGRALRQQLRLGDLAERVLAGGEQPQRVVGERGGDGSSLIAISAILWRIAWCLPIGRPKAVRSARRRRCARSSGPSSPRRRAPSAAAPTGSWP